MPFVVEWRHWRFVIRDGFQVETAANLTFFKTMKDILQAVLTDPSVRTADDIELLAVERAEFLTWT